MSVGKPITADRVNGWIYSISTGLEQRMHHLKKLVDRGKLFPYDNVVALYPKTVFEALDEPVRRQLIGVGVNISGTAQGGTATTIDLAAGTLGLDGALVNGLLKITGGTGAGQIRRVAVFAAEVPSPPTPATVTIATDAKNPIYDHPWAVVPDATSKYQFYPDTQNLIATILSWERLESNWRAGGPMTLPDGSLAKPDAATMCGRHSEVQS